MIIPFIYLIGIFAVTLLIISFVFKDVILAMLSSIFIMVLAIDVWINGLLGVNNYLTYAVAIVLSAMGGYVLLRSSLELLEMNSGSMEDGD